MERKKRAWWAGKAPEWVAEEENEGGAVQPAAAAAAAEPAVMPRAAPLPGIDPRLARLSQRRRGPSEAVVVRRRQRSPEEEEDAVAADGRGMRASPPAERRRDAGGEEGESVEEDEDEDEENIAARRMAIRARQLAAEAEAAAVSDEEGSEESSEYTTDDDSDDDRGPVMLKPAFVPKTERETLEERELVLAQAEQTTRQEADQVEERKRQTQELVIQAQLQDAQQAVPEKAESDLDTEDDKDEVAEYESWRERELQRIARDRQLRQAGTKAEAAAAAPASGMPGTSYEQPKKKWKFLQKYWHKGAFFQTEDEDGETVLGDIMRRDYDAATGEDRVDKQMLPKIMQVRNFGRRGRTKWSHLLNEDTTYQEGVVDPAMPTVVRPSRQQQQQDFSKPRMHKT